MDREPSRMFRTNCGRPVPAVTSAQMREVDRIAVDDVGLDLLQMMENAGRCLAGNAVEMVGGQGSNVAVLAGSGGNGGGGLCCARHLLNHGYHVSIALTKKPGDLRGAAAHQLRILQATGLKPVDRSGVEVAVADADLVVDALVGYSLHGAPRGQVAQLIELCNRSASLTLSLDVPSGLDATTGEARGIVVRPARILTLGLPKSGLSRTEGELFLADIGIPAEVYRRIGVDFEWPMGSRYWVALEKG